MNIQKPNDINRLMGLFLDLQEQWEDVPEKLNWEALRELARTRFDSAFEGTAYSKEDLEQAIAICGDSIPADVLEKLSAAVANPERAAVAGGYQTPCANSLPNSKVD